MFDIKATITGIQEAQAANQRRIAMLEPGNAFGRMIRDVTVELQRYAIGITHVLTGTLRAAHRVEVQGLFGRVFIDPGATNPKSKQRAAFYGVFEEARGGEHAFYGRTVAERGAQVMSERGNSFLLRVVRAE